VRVAALVLLVALSVRANECVTVAHRTARFFDGSVGVAEAVWRGDSFVVDRVLRGDLRPGDRVPHALAPCNALNDGETYLISINCRPDVDLDCRILWSNRFDRLRLLWVLDHLHRETHERILAKSVAWLTGRISLPMFHDWIDTAIIAPRDVGEDEFTRRLINDLSHFASTLSYLDDRETVRNEVDAFVRLARVFPRGTEEQFDAMFDACGDKQAPSRGEYGDALIKALTEADRVAFAHLKKW